MDRRQEDPAAARREFVGLAAAYAGSRLPPQLELELGLKQGELAERRSAGGD